MSKQTIQDFINVELDKMAPPYLFKGVESVDTAIANTVGITCSKCGNSRINMREEQRRSADEPASQFYLCLDCGNRWRVG